MTNEIVVNGATVSLIKADITDLEIDSFVFYAQEDLKLGSGYGTAIAVRGGKAIQEELDRIGPVKITEAVLSTAGELKANHIIHAVGPKFQEEDTESKLVKTIINVLRLADEKGIEEIAFPAMGAGFYGIPLEVSAAVTLQTIKDYLANGSRLRRVVISLLDTREYEPYQKKLTTMS
jgi:O-acetyl-ADP-ribose deacetylase (regulator of RNase III)